MFLKDAMRAMRASMVRGQAGALQIGAAVQEESR
jgi:hypothetical protein